MEDLYKIIKMSFPGYSNLVADGLTKSTAEKKCKKWNKDCDVYTSYYVEKMETEEVRKFIVKNRRKKIKKINGALQEQKRRNITTI